MRFGLVPAGWAPPDKSRINGDLDRLLGNPRRADGYERYWFVGLLGYRMGDKHDFLYDQ